jgi:hypothetical protein
MIMRQDGSVAWSPGGSLPPGLPTNGSAEPVLGAALVVVDDVFVDTGSSVEL